MIHWRNVLSTSFKSLTEKTRLGLITDVDGTISPIVDNPDQAQVTPRSRELLDLLQRHLALVAVVSGRAAEDVRQKVGLSHLVYLGNHGLERWEDNQVVLAPEVAQYRPAIQTTYDSLLKQLLPGMTLEDKTATLSIHYRQTDQPELVASQFRPIIESIAGELGLHVFEGRMIFEIRPPIMVNKGTAFRSLVNSYQLDGAIYIGDDTTDADALLMARQLRESGQCYALGVGVQSSDMPDVVKDAADVMASGISDVEELLAWLLKASSASSN